MSIVILVGGLILLLLLGVPVAFSLLLSSMTLILYRGTTPIIVIAQRMSNALDNFPLLAIPLFILAAEIMNSSGATEKIFNLAKAMVGHLTGGLAHVNVLASMLFSGMSGSAVADASGLGMIEIKAMSDDGYSLPFSAAVTAASSTIGPIIPPSVPMVVYGVVSGTSIGALFIAGAAPGVIMGLAMMIVIYFIAKNREINIKRDRISSSKFIKILLDSLPSMFLPVIILGGIWGGIFSPTEAAAVAVVYSLLLGIFIHKEIKIKEIPSIFLTAGYSTATIMLIVAAANLYGWLISIEQIPQIVQQGLLSVSQNPIIVMFLINIILLIMGMFMELIAIITIAVPVFLPLVTNLGIDPVFFGVIAVLNLMIGLLTPPFGLNIFIMQRVTGVPFWDIIKEAVPFIFILIGTLILLVLFPQIVMFLPNLMLG
jgi:tripartite ATP-independent transporter DctM subunit